MIKKGDILKPIFIAALPLAENAPKLNTNQEYKCNDVFIDKKGFPHIDVGLPLELNFVTSFATGETLPAHTHWCHPNRFIILKSAPDGTSSEASI